MPPATTPQSSAYLDALALQIQKKLQRALASASQSPNLLQELFADIALEVDDRAKGFYLEHGEDLVGFVYFISRTLLLLKEWDIIFSKKEAISAADSIYGCPVCFYNVLADYLVCTPQNGKSIFDLIVQLWSQSFASSIFTLLFHKWMFEIQFDNPEILLRYSLALVQGATNVFWIDIQTNARRFSSLFHYLLEEVALDSEKSKKIPPQAQRDLFLLLSRFLFFYDSAEKLEKFLQQFPDFPKAFLIGGASDIFVTEVADQVQKLKVEPVLFHYLSQIKVLRGIELRTATSTRLRTCLYSFTTPGGPMYPTRAVRHAAWDALDFLFPVGRYPRHMISLFFRLLYPWYWPSSCWNFLLSCIQAVLLSLFGCIFSRWAKLMKSKQS